MKVVLFDGVGREASGTITRADRRAMKVEVDEITLYPLELSRRLTIAVAMPKAPRQGYLIEKCTELGVEAIWPIITQRSVVKPTAASVVKWSRRAIEAAKQSNRSWVPRIEPPFSFDDCMEKSAQFDACTILDPDPSHRPFFDFLIAKGMNSTILAAIGPEGGWTEQERQRATEAAAVCTSLAPTVLRSETAAVAVCAVASALHQKCL